MELKNPLSAHLLDFLLIFVCLTTLAAFFVLEAWIDQSTVGTTRMILEIVAVVVEGWVVAACVTRPFRL